MLSVNVNVNEFAGVKVRTHTKLDKAYIFV